MSKTMTATKTKKTKSELPFMAEETRKRAEQLMRDYVQSFRNKKALQERIANELKSYTDNMTKAEKELLEIGEKHHNEFDVDGNLSLGDGYLHLVNNTVIIMSKKFDAKEFAKAFPDMIDMTKAMKTAAIKKAFLDKDQRKELKSFGVETGTEESMQVLIHQLK